MKKLKEQKEAKPVEELKIRTVDKVEKRDSSGSDTDPDEAHSSVLFLQVNFNLFIYQNITTKYA